MPVHESWWTCLKSSSNHNAECNYQHSQQWTKFRYTYEQQNKKLLLLGHGEDICIIIIGPPKKSIQDVVFNFTSRTHTCHEQRMTSWTNHVKNDKVLHRVEEEERNILCTIQQRKAKWIGHILHRNLMEGKIEGTRTQRRRLMQQLEDFEEKRRSWNLEDEALHCILWWTCFGRDYRPVASQMK